MPTTLRTWLRAEHGTSPISLIAIVASLVIVAAIAVPALKSGASSSSQTGQTAAATAAAQDVQAQTLVQTGQTAMATYAASNSGYTGVSPSALSAIEPTLVTASATEAYIASASGTATGYTLVAVNPLTHDTFTLTNTSGATTRTCAPAGHGGCPASGTF